MAVVPTNAIADQAWVARVNAQMDDLNQRVVNTHGGAQDTCLIAQSNFLPSAAHCIGVDRTLCPIVINECTRRPAVSSLCTIARRASRVSGSSELSR